MTTLVVNNPSRTRRKKKRSTTKRRRSTTTRRRASTRRPTRRRSTVARKRTTTRRRRSSSRARKLLTSDMVKQAGFTALGGVGSEMGVGLAARQFPSLTFLSSPVGRLAGKTAIGIGGGMLVSKFFNRSAGQAFTIGALSAVATELANRVFAGGLSGLGEYGGMGALGYGGGSLAALPAGGFVDAEMEDEFVNDATQM